MVTVVLNFINIWTEMMLWFCSTVKGVMTLILWNDDNDSKKSTLEMRLPYCGKVIIRGNNEVNLSSSHCQNLSSVHLYISYNSPPSSTYLDIYVGILTYRKIMNTDIERP